jgi:hypothetical protein
MHIDMEECSYGNAGFVSVMFSDAMEALLEEECLREKKLREYEEGRAEITQTLLSQSVLPMFFM